MVTPGAGNEGTCALAEQVCRAAQTSHGASSCRQRLAVTVHAALQRRSALCRGAELIVHQWTAKIQACGISRSCQGAALGRCVPVQVYYFGGQPNLVGGTHSDTLQQCDARPSSLSH